MAHLLSKEGEAKLRLNRFAWDHFAKFKPTYVFAAKLAKDFAKQFPETDTEPRRVDMVRAFILENDPNIFGLAFAVPVLSAEQIAECYARMVVGHDGG
jgi:hypothetical protein